MPDSSNKFISPAVVAALLWFSLTLYLFAAIPAQFAGLGKVTENMPAVSRFVLSFQLAHGTAYLALFGLIGCGIAYVKQSARLANVMIVCGSVVVFVLIWALLANLSKRP
jgi:hypothetical protein